MSPDPYLTLGVPPNATLHQIRAAYRRLAKLHHPDVSAAPEAVERMARINRAYEVLTGRAPVPRPPPPPRPRVVRVYVATTTATGSSSTTARSVGGWATFTIGFGI